jgi:hypothetical protein
MEEINWDGVNQDAQDPMSLQLPLVMWRHGKLQMKQLGEKNLNYTGGFFFSYEAAGNDTVIDLWSEASFQGDKDEVRGLGASTADIALVRARRRWFREVDGKFEFRAWNNYEPGMRGHLQYVGFIKGYEHPVTFSFKGLLGQAIEAIQREHMSKVVSLVNRKAPKGKGLPPYALWVRVKSGKHEKVGSGQQQSEVTMPFIGLPNPVDEGFARGRFVGNANLSIFQDLYIEASDWAREWDYKGGAEEARQDRNVAAPTADPAINDPNGAYAPEAPAYDDIPF